MSLLADLNRAVAATLRKPAVNVTVNGMSVPGVIEAEVTNNTHFASDTFRAVFAVSALPPALGPAYWAKSRDDRVSVEMGFEGESLLPLITGQVDDIEYDPVARTLALHGRDLSAPLIDAKTAEKFINQTSSQIAETLAKRRGLVPVTVATQAKAGTYYNDDHVELTQEQSEWDLLTYLAEREGYDVWVSGDRLHFEPSPLETNPVYALRWDEAARESNVLDLRLSRSQTLAKDIVVVVRSWNNKLQRAFKVEYRVTQPTNPGREQGRGEFQTYSFNIPNLTRDQCLAVAKARAEEITRHERVLSATMPGDSVLATRAMVSLVGTGTGWDQLYYPEAVTRRISFEEGYRMELRAKNHPAQSTVVIG